MASAGIDAASDWVAYSHDLPEPVQWAFLVSLSKMMISVLSWIGSAPSLRYGIARDIGAAIVEEKRIRKWRRALKIRLIDEMNPDWRELYGGIGW